MTITDAVIKEFDKTRSVDFSRLDFLHTLDLEPQFMEACEKMFVDCQAGVQEVVDIKETIVEENTKLIHSFKNLNYKRTAGSYSAFLKNVS